MKRCTRRSTGEPESVAPRERGWSQKATRHAIPLTRASRTGRSVATACGRGAAWAGGGGCWWEGVSLWGDKDVNLTVPINSELYPLHGRIV